MITRRQFLNRTGRLVPVMLCPTIARGIVVTPADPAFVNNSSNAAACATAATPRDEWTGTTTANNVLGTTTNVYVAAKFTAAETATICKVTIPFFQELTPDQDISVAIYSDNSGEPGSVIGFVSNQVNASTFPASEGTEAVFTGLVAPIIAATTYWVVAINNSAANDAEYVRWPAVLNDAGDTKIDANGTTPWDGSNAHKGKFKLFSA